MTEYSIQGSRDEHWGINQYGIWRDYHFMELLTERDFEKTRFMQEEQFLQEVIKKENEILNSNPKIKTIEMKLRVEE